MQSDKGIRARGSFFCCLDPWFASSGHCFLQQGRGDPVELSPEFHLDENPSDRPDQEVVREMSGDALEVVPALQVVVEFQQSQVRVGGIAWIPGNRLFVQGDGAVEAANAEQIFSV